MTPQQRRFSKIGLIVATGIAAMVLFAPLPVEIRTRIYKTATIERPPAMVFDYVTTPRNWPAWHPSSLEVRGATNHSALPGERIEEAFSVAGFRGQVEWTVLVRDAPHRWVIDGALANGGSGRISYALTAEGSGTRFEREFVYVAPNLLFVVLDGLFVRDRIDGESAEALKRLKAVLESLPTAGQ
jgi:uncharacterized protein YndB with AHSA1/START domain